MSHQVRSKPIRDVIHNYVDVTPLEQTIIDLPAFQRLRFIAQNSSAYLTYPCNTHTRFSHSLGVMHISGRMFVAAIENADLQILVPYLASFRKAMVSKLDRLPKLKDLGEACRRLSGVCCKFGRFDGAPHAFDQAHANTSIPKTPPGLSDDDYLTILTLWQSVRLCAMIHDLGHLPMSHVFEYALEECIAKEPATSGINPIREEFLTRRQAAIIDELPGSHHTGLRERQTTKERLQWHELIGLHLFRECYAWHQGTILKNDDDKHYCTLVYKLAEEIFLSFGRYTTPSDPEHLFQCLHTIISSDIDADRLDYCIRDPQSSGLEFNAFDLDRIISSLCLTKSSTRGSAYEILPSYRATSAIESFFNQRYLMYKYLIYHHNVARFDGVMRESLIRMFSVSFGDLAVDEEGKALRDLFRIFAFSFENPSAAEDSLSFKRYEFFDDCWLRSLFLATLKCLEKLKDRQAITSFGEELMLLLRTWLFRQSHGIVSLWKVDAEFYDIITTVKKKCSPLNLRSGVTFEEVFLMETRGANLEMLSDLFAKQVKTRLGKGFIPIVRGIKPKTVGPDELMVIGPNGEPRKLSSFSRLLRSLKEVGEQMPSIHFAVVFDPKKHRKEDLRTTLVDVACESIEAWWTNGKFADKYKRRTRNK